MEKKQSNVLRIGISSLQELEEKVKAFRNINLSVKKKRYIISREDIIGPHGEILIKKGEDFDSSKVMLLKRTYKKEHIFKTFQPDEGIVLVSDMATAHGIQFSMDLVTQVMNIGGGAYEAFIDRIDSFKEVNTLFNKALFPKLIIVGHIPPEKKNEEIAFYHLIKRADPYIRIVEVSHSAIKNDPFFPKVKQIFIQADDKESWKYFLIDIMAYYTKPYTLED